MRYWPRGVRKDRFDAYAPNLAPSPALLKKFQQRVQQLADETRAAEYEQPWLEFVEDYRAEMKAQHEAITALAKRHRAGETITLLCGCHDASRCHRTILASIIVAEDTIPADVA